MATTKPAIVTFAGGEVDSYTDVRIDLSVHPNTAKRLENVSLITQGAMELAPGTKYIGDTPANGPAWLAPWSLSVDFSFMLELSDALVRFIFDEGFVTLDGTLATLGSFTEDSGSPSGGGGVAPGGDPLVATLNLSSVDADGASPVTCSVTGGSGLFTFDWGPTSGILYPTAPNSATTAFGNAYYPTFAAGAFSCHVTDTVTGQTTDSPFVLAGSGNIVLAP